MTDRPAAMIRTDVERLCAAGDRDLGTKRNRDATDYVVQRLRQTGLLVETLEFEVPEWRCGRASVKTDGLELTAHPGPFSPALEGEGPLVAIRSADEISAIDAPDSVLLLCGEIAATQFTPRGYPFYSNPDHSAILDALEAKRPLAVLSATDKSPMTGAMSPFPLIEDVRFAAPSAYMSVEKGAELSEHVGDIVAVSIDSEVHPSTGVQPVGRRAGTRGGRIVVSAHIDSKPETPGAIDNAAGVAVLLAVADLVRNVELEYALEFVPFNGEDHVLAPGELAWLAANEDLSDIRLAINIDAPGLLGAPSAYSLYGVDEATAVIAASLSDDNANVIEGPQWPASDHMIFAMRGIPTIAVTTADFASGASEVFHTPADAPETVDYDLLAGAARFVADLIAKA